MVGKGYADAGMTELTHAAVYAQLTAVGSCFDHDPCFNRHSLFQRFLTRRDRVDRFDVSEAKLMQYINNLLELCRKRPSLLRAS